MKKRKEKKKTHFKNSFFKRNFETSFSQNFVFELRLDLILYERGTQVAFSMTRSQSSKKKLHFKKDFSKLHFFKTLFSNYVWTQSSMREICRQPFRKAWSQSLKKKKNSKTQNQDISLCEFRLSIYFALSISSIFCASVSKLGALAQNIFIITNY